MSLKKLNLEQLYRGYVLSFHTLSIPIEKSKRNWFLFTHKVISYWSNVGLSLGFYPWCEEEKRDLGWWSEPHEKYILHLESENSPTRIKHTIQKLKKSQEKYKIGILFITDKNFTSAELEKELKEIKTNETLVITKWWNKEIITNESSEKCQYYGYTITGHLIKKGELENLDEALCIWDKFGTLRMFFPNEPNW